MQKPNISDGKCDNIYGSPERTPETTQAEEKIEQCCICTDPLSKDSIPVTLPCGHRGHHNCLMGIQNKLCPLCRGPIPDTLEKRVYLEEDPLDGKEPPLWEYESRDGVSWWQYLPAHSSTIEEKYQAWKSSSRASPSLVELTVRGKIYKLDFRVMKQSSPEGYTRSIRRREPTRDPENIKGIAGAVPM